MVEPVALLLVGRGHVVIRARDAGLATVADNVLVEYALIKEVCSRRQLDPDIRRSIRRCGARCLHVHPPSGRRERDSLTTTAKSSRTSPDMRTWSRCGQTAPRLG